MKRVNKFILYLLVGTIIVIPAFVNASEPRIFLPTAEHMYGEAIFASAYQKALEGKVGNALEELEETLRYDPYLVSYYLLRGYCFSLLGDYAETRRNLELYLEVKPDDPFAIGFLKEIEDRSVYLEKSLSSGISSSTKMSGPGNFRDKFDLDIFWGSSFSMPGRPSLMGNILTLCDTMNQKVWVYKKNEKGWSRYYSGKAGGQIVRALPTGGDSLVLVFSDGTFLRGSFNRKVFSEILRGNTQARSISDASFAGAGRIVLAERIMGRIFVVNISDGKTLYSWHPSSSGFEPVSLASLGPLLAVADRMGNRVFILDIQKGKEITNFNITGHPRSVEWLNSEKLLVLTEERELFELSLKDERSSRIGGAFPEAWFLFSNGQGEVLVTDTRLYRCSNIITKAEKGFLALKYPRPVSAKRGNRQNWIVEARLIHPLGRPSGTDERIFQGILGGNLIDVVETEITYDSAPIEKPSLPDPADEEFIRGPAVQLLLDPGNIPQDLASLTLFGGYALSNGIVIHLLADKVIPDLYQLRLSEATGGRMILSRDQIPDLRPCLSLNFRIAFKPSLELPGNPKASGLFITGRFANTVMEGRIPFWNGFLPFPR